MCFDTFSIMQNRLEKIQLFKEVLINKEKKRKERHKKEIEE